MVLISQDYPTGQFCLNSTRMRADKYWKVVDELSDRGGDDDD